MPTVPSIVAATVAEAALKILTVVVDSGVPTESAETGQAQQPPPRAVQSDLGVSARAPSNVARRAEPSTVMTMVLPAMERSIAADMMAAAADEEPTAVEDWIALRAFAVRLGPQLVARVEALSASVEFVPRTRSAQAQAFAVTTESHPTASAIVACTMVDRVEAILSAAQD